MDIGKKDTRSTSVFEVIEKMRPLVSKIPDTRVSLKEDFGMGSIRRDVEFQIKGANLDEIKALGALVQAGSIQKSKSSRCKILSGSGKSRSQTYFKSR
ncbi:Uncharacterised protein [Fusobacterium necrophorum subsp. necrophorum]|nr:Uncharacterised protein [Fusobacterium necrophorum subsp. necrophorum]